MFRMLLGAPILWLQILDAIAFGPAPEFKSQQEIDEEARQELERNRIMKRSAEVRL